MCLSWPYARVAELHHCFQDVEPCIVTTFCLTRPSCNKACCHMALVAMRVPSRSSGILPSWNIRSKSIFSEKSKVQQMILAGMPPSSPPRRAHVVNSTTWKQNTFCWWCALCCCGGHEFAQWHLLCSQWKHMPHEKNKLPEAMEPSLEDVRRSKEFRAV